MLGCGAFLIGLVVGRRVGISGWLVLASLPCALVALHRRTRLAVVWVVLVGLLLGTWRGMVYMQQLRPYKMLARHAVVFMATADADAVYGTKSQLSFAVRNVHITYPRSYDVPGTVKVSGFGETMVYRGDRLEVQGSLYPTRGASQATVSFAQLHKVGGSSTVIDTLRRKFTAGTQTALPEPLASFGLGLLIGQRNTLPEALTQALLMVGLTHIIAVSGYNLTILLEACRRLIGERSKVASTVTASVLIGGFLLIAGTSASIVRAAVVSVLGLSAWYYGRQVRPTLLILLAAVGTAYANPVYIWADISWYLSFLAFYGVLVLAPNVTHRLCGKKEPHMLLQIAIESVCAEIMTLPLILYIFGQMSLVSLLANVLVAAFIPLAMLLSFVAGLAGMLASGIAGWLAWPARLLLTYMVDVVNMLSRIPYVFQQNKYLTVVDMILFYTFVVIITAMSYVLQRRRPALAMGSTEVITTP